MKLIYSLLFILLGLHLNAQSLERGGSLGSYIATAENEGGVLIQKVIPKSTSEKIGLQTNDIITAINGEEIKRHTEIVNMTREWRAGDPLKLQVLRAGKTIELSGYVSGKPLETSPYGEVIYGAVAYDKGLLRSILTLPENVENPPVIFFLQGFSCSTIDYYYNQESVIRKLIDSWVKEGIAVYRVEKPGVGDCKDLPACADIGFNYEVDAFHTALLHLKNIPSINPEEIYLFGHSLGGVTAPLLAARTPVKGIVNYGSVATSWYEYLIKVLREQEAISGTPYDQIELNVRQRTPLLHEYLVEKKSPAELEKNPLYKELMPTGLPVRDGDKMIGRHYTFMQEINDANIVQALKEANCYVLALHGEFDLHAVDYEWAEQTAKIVNSFSQGKGSWKIIPKTEHGFAIVPSMEAYLKMRNEGIFNGQYMSEHYNPEVAEAVIEWIKKINLKS